MAFELPQWTQMPNRLIDELLPDIKSLAELKVVLIVIRSTVGYHEEEEQLSLKDLCDRGGMVRNSAIEGVKRALASGTIVRRVEGEPGAQKVHYTLNLAPSANSALGRVAASANSELGASADLALGPDTRVQDSAERKTERNTPFPPQEGELSEDELTKRRQRADERDRVFAAWDESKGGHGRAVLDPKRRRLIDWALDHYPLQDCLDAAVGWRRIAHNRGENDRGRPFNDIKLLFRDADNFERFRDAERAAGRQAPPARHDDTDRRLLEAEL